MRREEVIPFFHPTSVVVVDDDPEFLESFSFRFGDKWQCKTFDDPCDALDYVKRKERGRQGLDRFVSSAGSHANGIDAGTHQSLVGFHSAEINALMNEAERFAQVSVMIVDYEMPRTTGLELCEMLADAPVCKLLLTGKVGKDLAIEAFNTSLIDGFIDKHSADLSDVILEQVQRLQQNFFARTTGAVGSLHALENAPYLKDPVFQILFEKIRKQHGVVEYYTIAEPSGVYMVLNDGSSLFLRMLDDNQHRSQFEVATVQNAPQDLVAALKDKAIVPCFPTLNGYYDDSIKECWKRHTYRSNILNGDVTWRFCLIEGHVISDILAGNVVSYFDYRNGATN